MKKLLIFISLISVLNAESIFNKAELNRIALESAEKVWIPKEEVKEVKKEFKINLGIGLNTTHINMYKDEYEFYENNHIFTLELERNKELIGISHFTNSFNNESLALYYGIVKDNNNKGFYGTYKVGIVKGYHSKDYLPSKNPKFDKWEVTNYNVFYKDYGVLLSCGFGYKINENINLECNLLGNAIVTGIKLSY